MRTESPLLKLLTNDFWLRYDLKILRNLVTSTGTMWSRIIACKPVHLPLFIIAIRTFYQKYSESNINWSIKTRKKISFFYPCSQTDQTWVYHTDFLTAHVQIKPVKIPIKFSKNYWKLSFSGTYRCTNANLFWIEITLLTKILTLVYKVYNLCELWWI